MAAITLAAALVVLAAWTIMKMELRIDSAITEHDDLISKQIQSAVSYVSRGSTGAVGDDLLPLRCGGGFTLSRELYDGYREIGPR